MGLPSIVRKNLWKILLEDKFEIFDYVFINLNNSNKKLEEVIKRNSILDDEMISNSPLKNKVGKLILRQSFIKDLKTDVEKVYQHFIKHLSKKENSKDELYKIVRWFNIHRPEIFYTESMIYICTVLYLVYEDCNETFIAMINFIIPNYFYHFLSQNEDMIKEYVTFFDLLFSKRLNKLYIYLNKKGIKIEPFFKEWAEYLFSKQFPLQIVKRIWDCFLLQGCLVLFRAAISFLKLIETDIMEVYIYYIYYRQMKMII